MTNALQRRGVTTLVHQPRPVFYRFQEALWSESRIMLTLATYPLIKTTPAGAWIDVYGQKKFVLLTARKRFACPTVEEALASYHARKQRQIRILRHQLAKAEAALALQRDGDTIYFDRLFAPAERASSSALGCTSPLGSE